MHLSIARDCTGYQVCSYGYVLKVGDRSHTPPVDPASILFRCRSLPVRAKTRPTSAAPELGVSIRPLGASSFIILFIAFTINSIMFASDNLQRGLQRYHS